MSKYVISMIIFALLPFVFAGFSYLFWILLKVLNPKRFKETYLRNFTATILVFVFLLYPAITRYTFSMFNCMEIEGVSYLISDFSIECWSPYHIRTNILITLPIVLVWVIGFPVLVFILLYKNRFVLDDKATIMKYGLYYIGFKDKTFYW